MKSPHYKLLAATILGVAALATAPLASATGSYYNGWNDCNTGGSSGGSSSGGSGSSSGGTGSCPTGQERVVFDFDNGSGSYGSDPAGIGVTVTAWKTGTSNNGGTNFNATTLSSFTGGLGAGGEGYSPEHAIDNKNGFEFLLMTFDEAVALCDLQIGWPSSGYDTDMMVLAFTGGGGAAPTMTSYDTNNLISSGWEIIGNPQNVNENVWTSIGNGSNTTSSYWLVGTDNYLLSGNYDSYDYAKLLSVRTCCGPTGGGSSSSGGGSVPEPATLGLLGLGFIGARFSRRRLNAVKG